MLKNTAIQQNSPDDIANIKIEVEKAITDLSILMIEEHRKLTKRFFQKENISTFKKIEMSDKLHQFIENTSINELDAISTYKEIVKLGIQVVDSLSELIL